MKAKIKAFLDQGGIPSQFVLADTLKRSSGKMGVFGNILKQVNAKVKLDLYRLIIPLKNAMVVGVDVVNEGRKSIIGFTSSLNQFFSQYYSCIAH
jgi:hypothetical protein